MTARSVDRALVAVAAGNDAAAAAAGCQLAYYASSNMLIHAMCVAPLSSISPSDESCHTLRGSVTVLYCIC